MIAETPDILFLVASLLPGSTTTIYRYEDGAVETVVNLPRDYRFQFPTGYNTYLSIEKFEDGDDVSYRLLDAQTGDWPVTQRSRFVSKRQILHLYGPDDE